MIEHIRTIGFKGFDLDEDVPEKVLYCGKNRSGKSTRAAAIALVIYGHIPFLTSGKKPADIINSYGSSKSLVVSATIGGVEFARKFSKTATGATQAMQVGGKKKNAQDFAVELQKAGAPKIANVAEFMAQSEQKKIDTLFDLFPSGDDLSSLDNDIEDAKSKVSRIEKQKSGAVAVVQRLTESKSNITLPSGTLAEVKQGIKDTETKISELEVEIKEAEIKEAEDKKEKETETRVIKEQEEKKVEPVVALVKNETVSPTYSSGIRNESSSPSSGNFWENKPSGSVNTGNITPIEQAKNEVPANLGNIHNPVDSIQRILDALKSTGCSICAASVIAKQELKKYKVAL